MLRGRPRITGVARGRAVPARREEGRNRVCRAGVGTRPLRTAKGVPRARVATPASAGRVPRRGREAGGSAPPQQ